MSLTRLGRYQLENEIGRGGFATVYKGVDPLIGRMVAVKAVFLTDDSDPDQQERRLRLYREAQSAGSLNHQNIVAVYDIGEENNVAYIAMEFVDGENLETWLSHNPIPSMGDTLDIIRQIAVALGFAASYGIVHRDVKPGNVILAEGLKVKVTDFGVAKLAASVFTLPGRILGTPSYMSPEQAQGLSVDARSDIFSLGAIFYRMVTGIDPFAGSGVGTILHKVVGEDPPLPSQHNAALPRELDRAIMCMLAKKPADRYPSCAELLSDLAAIRQSIEAE
jgi:eukaryotic-like serine/threonine-protein kinase